MQDLNLNILFFTELLTGIALVIAVVMRFRLLCLCAIKIKESLSMLKSKELPLFYSSYAVKQECIDNFFNLTPRPAVILERAAAQNIKKAAPQIRAALHQTPQDLRLLLLNAEISLLQNNRRDFSHLMEELSLPFFSPRVIKAKYHYLSAQNSLYQTDMDSASKHASVALKLYKKLNFLFEEALCYTTLGQIYRISGVSDVAFTMLKEAKKLYTRLEINAKLAETEAYFGLIEIGRENYNTALQYLKSAEDIARRQRLNKTRADINNWQGLALFLSNRETKAAACFKKAEEKGTPAAQAFAAEMLARINYKQNNLKSALQYASTALTLCQKQNNLPGVFENLYLKAQILYQNNQTAQAKEILTALIKQKTPQTIAWYPANAYTFLGLIELKQNNISQAKTLFKEALDMELSRNRLKGAAIDYNNLAELALMEKDNASAKTYQKQALSYAQATQDEELTAIFKKKL